MNKENLKSELKKIPVIRVVNVLYIMSAMLLCSSLFIAIWGSISLAVKIALTGLLGMLVFLLVIKLFDIAINKAVEEYEEPASKSDFQKKLEEVCKNRKQTLNQKFK